MATSYLSPGVYVEEVDRGSKPIECQDDLASPRGLRQREGRKASGQRKTPRRCCTGAFYVASLTMSYFRGKYIPLSSALSRFTVLFGMGRSGSNSLWSSGKTDDLLNDHRQRQQPSRDPIGRSKGYIVVAIALAFAPQLTEEAARL